MMNSQSRDALVFATGAALGAGFIYWMSHYKRRQETTKLENGYTEPIVTINTSDDTILGSTIHTGDPQAIEHFESDDILAEQLTRNVQFFGLENQKKIANSFVVVIGLGGVGSHAAHLLLRSGVGRLRLVDFDQVTLSSLNRHCLATRTDVGMPKATCLLKHFKNILPEAHIEALCEMYNDQTEDMILDGNPDFVLDAIDNIDTKVALLAACQRRNIPVLCVAGAGAKADPTRIRIGDISEVSTDPLARSVRYRLRHHYSITSNIPVLFSNERPRCGLIFHGDENSDVLDYQIVPGFRIRTIPVLGTTPAIFGLAAAGYILCTLAEAPFDAEPLYKIPIKAIQTQYDRLESREIDRYGTADGMGVDIVEVDALVRELWRGASARAPLPPSSHQSLIKGLADLTLTRWNPAREAVVDNLILLTKSEADEHDEMVNREGGFEMMVRGESEEFLKKVNGILDKARREFMHGGDVGDD